MRAFAVPVVVLLLLSAGCVRTGDDVAPAAETEPVDTGRTHVLAPEAAPEGASSAPGQTSSGGPAAPPAANSSAPAARAPREPDELTAPTFRLAGALAQAGPVFGAGEPGVWADLAGRIFVTFPGCDASGDPERLALGGGCAHAPVLLSEDDGATWVRLDDDGRLGPDGPSANGDADVAVDAAGNVYAANLGGGGIQVHVRPAANETWTYRGDVVPEDGWADRQWIAAAADGHAILAWMGGPESAKRQVAVVASRDMFNTWTNVTYLGEDIGWLGSVQFAPDGHAAYIPFTESLTPRVQGLAGEGEFAVMVARTLDGGATWEVLDTNARTTVSQTSTRWSGLLMAPTLDVTGDGHVVLAWSEEVHDPAGLGTIGSVVKATWSADAGASWSAPTPLTSTPNAIMPWLTGGAGDRFAFTVLESIVPGDPDRIGAWRVAAHVVDGIAEGSLTLVSSVIEDNVHQGGICTTGSLCLATASDRALLDYFESDLLPDGRLVVTYPADPVTGGKTKEIRVAIQDGGTPLLVA